MLHFRNMTRLIVLFGGLLALSLVGCGGLTTKEDPRTVEAVVSQAEQLIKSKAYAAAASEYAVAIRKAPLVGRYYLRRAELLERIDEDEDAHDTYAQALKNVPEEDPDHLQIIHRLALVDANHLLNIDEAEELLKRMPKGSIEKLDLAAFLYYQSSQPDQAIILLNKALERVRSSDQKALLLYHAALVYVSLGDQKNTFGSLYYAINNAEHLGLIRDIEQLWEKINETPKNGPPGVPNS